MELLNPKTVNDAVADFVASKDSDWLEFVYQAGFNLSRRCLDSRKSLRTHPDYQWREPFKGCLWCKQYPQELAQYLEFIYDHSSEIKSYFELGIEGGGTFQLVAALLKAIHGDEAQSVGLDIKLKDPPIVYASENDNVSVVQTPSVDYTFEDDYDLILIDGDHTYAGVKADYEKAVNHCKYLALHDIYLPQEHYITDAGSEYAPGVSILWNEIKDKHPIVAEISNTNPCFKLPVGIGILKIK